MDRLNSIPARVLWHFYQLRGLKHPSIEPEISIPEKRDSRVESKPPLSPSKLHDTG
jgi:hypothetical protein